MTTTTPAAPPASTSLGTHRDMAPRSSSHLLTALPLELLVFVIDNLDRVEDIAALALTNRRLYSAANRLLYRQAARCHDARPLAWAANRGLVSTLNMALAAGVDPNYEFVEQLSADEWERVSAAARADAAAGRPKELWAMWDFNNRPIPDAKWSPEPEVADDTTAEHAATPAPSSTAAPSPGPAAGSDLDSVVSSEEDLSHRSDATPATETSTTPTPDWVTRRYYAVHLAARGGHNEILQLLVRHGARVNVPSQRFCACTPLYGLLNALEHPEPEADRPLWSPLHTAICHSHTETAKLLLAHKASAMMETAPGDPHDTPISYSSTDAGYGATALHHAAGMGLGDLVRHILDAKIQTDINAQDHNTLTPFYFAYAHRRWTTTVPLLLSLGASIECEIKMYIPYTAITPLGEACRLGDFAAADALLDLGADATHGFVALTSGGCLTPLHMCCMRSAQPAGRGAARGQGRRRHRRRRWQRRRRRSARPGAHAHHREADRAGARLDARDCFGSTPLMAAKQACNIFALEALSIAGVDDEEKGEGHNTEMNKKKKTEKEKKGVGAAEPEAHHAPAASAPSASASSP
ncbi:hypothetical protein NEMBOFW57_007830 [Staphylotrichum longicolle]|uniref:Ankyrin repeat protein n=1 Tax=Staphylotrichum longicolle TaxID=669026 RepID=A0AAD4EVG4_9PEZI|nr:hypothetical protein NEMBOFW57_007830 [Staphylotrichum longicolle]